jgi:hypothetical protein
LGRLRAVSLCLLISTICIAIVAGGCALFGSERDRAFVRSTLIAVDSVGQYDVHTDFLCRQVTPDSGEIEVVLSYPDFMMLSLPGPQLELGDIQIRPAYRVDSYVIPAPRAVDTSLLSGEKVYRGKLAVASARLPIHRRDSIIRVSYTAKLVELLTGDSVGGRTVCRTFWRPNDPDSTEWATYIIYPNPMSPYYGLHYFLPEPGHVRVEVLDSLSHPVRTVIEEDQGPGDHRVDWDLVRDNGRAAYSGFYRYRLTAGDWIEDTYFLYLR